MLKLRPYASPQVAFVASLMALEQLESTVPFLATLLCWLGPTVRSLLAAFLPSLALLLFLASLPKLCAKLAAMHGDVSLAQAQVRTIEGVWIFQFVWVLFGASVMNGLLAGNDAVGVATEYASNATFFMIFLSIKALFSTPFGGLARVPLIVVESVKKRLGLQAANIVLPEPLAYDDAWPQVLLSASAGIMYAAICPPILPFVIFHLGVCYLVFARGLLFSHTRGWMSGKADGGQGLAWVMASKWLLVALGSA